ncbi:esterase AGAP003155 isoform X2 [Diorhabda carinulata]|uniref:esterase AGAP003155 isoform X2 n=1 Tax=Diorhabda carinulata TaxID=1163345 RepID=UPI0025A01AE9|nr:esterase AGAP003155 isoform X2 [Diorhabda carinulata]
MNQPPVKCCPNDKMKLKILAIHGYRQNAETFKAKTGSFRKIVHKWAEFTYITAPHKVILVDDPNDLDKNNQDIGQKQYGWFFNRDDLTFRGIRKGGPAIGFEESVKFIEDVFEKEGPFDGILGFSQGACFAGLLCDLQQRGLTKFTFSFAVLASGFKSGSLPHLKYYIDRITIPTLHIFGENDQIIPTEMSEALSNCFEDPVIVKHPGGHYLPAAAAQKHDYQKFIKLQLLQKSVT